MSETRLSVMRRLIAVLRFFDPGVKHFFRDYKGGGRCWKCGGDTFPFASHEVCR